MKAEEAPPRTPDILTQAGSQRGERHGPRGVRGGVIPAGCGQMMAFGHYSSGLWFSLSLSCLANNLNPVAISHHRKYNKEKKYKTFWYWGNSHAGVRIWGGGGMYFCYEMLSCAWKFLGCFWSMTFFLVHVHHVCVRLQACFRSLLPTSHFKRP